MDKLILSLFCLFFSSCSSVLGDVNPIYRTEANFAKKVEKKYGISAYGFGGSFCNKISIIDVDFESNEYSNIEQARELIVNMARMLLEEVNTDLKVRDNLVTYPYQVENIVLIIIFIPGYEDCTNTCLAEVVLSKGRIRYNTFDHEQSAFVEMHSETFEEATQKLSVFK